MCGNTTENFVFEHLVVARSSRLQIFLLILYKIGLFSETWIHLKTSKQFILIIMFASKWLSRTTSKPTDTYGNLGPSSLTNKILMQANTILEYEQKMIFW